MFSLRGAIVGLAGLMLAGCGVGEGTGSTPPWAETDTPVAPAASTSDEEAPEPVDPYRVRITTTKGDVVIDVHPEWAPHGAARFKELVETGYYNDNRIFRVVPGLVVQFGMHGDPETSRIWSEERIKDDPVTHSNTRGTVTFATSGSDSRTTQIFINLDDNQNLDSMPQNFAPFGEVVEGMDVVESFNAEYEEAPTGEQARIMTGGNQFLDSQFPGLDSVVTATIVEAGGDPPAAGDAGEAAENGQQQDSEKNDETPEGAAAPAP